MSSNDDQLSSQVYSHTFSTANTNLRTVTLPQNDSLSLNTYVIADTRQHQMETSRQPLRTYQSPHQTSGAPITPYLDYSLPYQNSARDHVQGYESPLDNRLDSPRNVNSSFSQQAHNSFSDTSGGRVPQRLHRPASVGHVGHTHRHGSIDGSDATSPTSSREFGPRGSDESVPHEHHNLARNGKSGGDSRIKEEVGRPPPWSELKTKAGKERKRLPLACIACRRKKIRCSGEKPACKHCLRSRIPCVYKVTTRKAAPRTDYMAMLDKRLKRMEERVIKIIPKEDIGKLPSIGRANVKPPPSNQGSKPNSSKKRVAEEAFGKDIDNWAHANSNPGDLQSRQTPKDQDQAENRLLVEGAESLPTKEIQEHLAEVFFDCVYGQSYLVLHKPSFMRRLRAGTVPPVLILAVCAISARFSTHPQVNTEPAFLRGESWAKPAREISLRRYDEPNITTVTVLLILGLHEFGTCQGGRSWMFGGMAMRMAYALQLHRELDHDPLGRKHDKSSELSFTDREIRRRTMWACFLMDRFNSSGTERPTIVNEENIQVQLPIKESYFQMEIPGPTENLEGAVPNPILPDAGQISDPKENMGVASYMIRIIAIWGRVVKYMNLGGNLKDAYPMWHSESQYAKLKKQVEDFKCSLPESLMYTPGNLQNHAAEKLANQFLYLHISLNGVILFVHKFAIPMTPGARTLNDMPKDFVNTAVHTALEASAQVSILLNDATDYLVAAPFAGYCSFLSSTVHIWGIFSKFQQFEVSSKRYLAYNVKYLSKMKKHWGMFHYMAENLKDIYRRYADAALKGPNAKGSEKQDGLVFQYGDWFDKYPHGVSGTDYQDPAMEAKRGSADDAALGLKSDLQTVEEFFTTLSPAAPLEQQRKVAKRHGRDGMLQDAKVRLQHIKTEQPSSHTNLAQQSHAMLNVSQHHQPQTIDSASYPQELYTPSHPNFPLNSFTTNPLMPLAHPGTLLPELDRQMAYGTYTSDNPTAVVASNPLNQLMSNGNNGLWDHSMDFSQAMAVSQGYGDIGSSAWLMPFNLNPPDIGTNGEFIGMGGYGGEVDINERVPRQI